MKNEPPNQGEGDRASARKNNRQVREFIADGNVDRAAEHERVNKDARRFLEREPEEAERAERTAKRGPQGTRVVERVVDKVLALYRAIIGRRSAW